MAVNRGKKFEGVIREALLKVPDTSVIRLPDPTQGYLGVRNISDFIVYHYPYQYFIECKSVHGNILPFSNITKNQYEGMLEVSEVEGVIAGVMCWWIDNDITRFIPINIIAMMKSKNIKSIRYDVDAYLYGGLKYLIYQISGKKKRIFFDYDMNKFFKDVGKVWEK